MSELMGEGGQYPGYKVWPTDWRAVHFMQRDETNVPLVLAPILENRDFPFEICIDGDCGLVWGEPRTERCLWHIQVYCPSDKVHRVLECLRSDKENEITGRKHTRYYTVVTDPNDWGGKVNTIEWTTQRCNSKKH